MKVKYDHHRGNFHVPCYMFRARYMEISMYHALVVPCNETQRKVHGNFHVPRNETHGKVHGNFHVPRKQTYAKVHGNFRVPCQMFRRRRKLTEITSITDKFANRF